MTRVRVSVLGAVVLLLALASACSDDDKVPGGAKSPSATPSYYAKGVPYVFNGTLYIDHQAQPGQWVRSESAGGYTAVTKTGADGAFTLVLLNSATGKQVLTADRVFSAPQFSPRGTKLAWLTQSGTTGSLTVLDLDPYRTLGTLRFTFAPDKEGSTSGGLDVDDKGRVSYDINEKGFVWKPGGGPPVRSDGALGTSAVNPPGFDGVTQDVRLNIDQLWGAWIDTNGDLVAQHPGDPSTREILARPPGTGKHGHVEWKSLTVALIDTQEFDHHNEPVSVACDVIAKICDVGQTDPKP